MDSSSIPVMRSPNDLMVNGPNSDNFAASAIQAHPVDRMQRGKISFIFGPSITTLKVL